MKHSFIDGFLNGEEIKCRKSPKGVCAKCGHYAPVFPGKFGAQICKDCQSVLEQRKK